MSIVTMWPGANSTFQDLKFTILSTPLPGNMPCYTAPYADRSRLDAVMAHLPGDVDSLDPLFAAVPWS